jgi:anti-sigma regulatory factor (Ser/Thr protein kinase)
MGRLRSTESVLSSFPAVAASVPEARNVVASLAARYGASWEDIERIRLVVSEVVTNAVVHAYANTEEAANVHVTAAVIADELTIVVADDGCGLGSAPASPGLGLGLGLVANTCDAFSIVTRPYGGTQLEMRITLSARGVDAPARRRSHGSTPAEDVLSFEGR